MWLIYHKDGSVLKDAAGEKVGVHSLEYSDTWMGECYLSITIESAYPIEFSIGDYITYRDETFEINYDPGKIKCARPGSYGSAFKYDSVKFNSLSDELARCEMLDVVMGKDTDLHYTALPKFSFYIETLDDLLDRIQANLDEQIGKGEWKLYSRNLSRSEERGCTKEDWLSVYGSEDIEDNAIDSTSVTLDSQTCWDALGIVNSEFDVNFITRGRNVYVGTVGLPTENIFEYGKGNGLYELDQTSESDQEVVTRLRAYGSTTNVPTRYYADLGAKYFATIAKISATATGDNPHFDIRVDLTWDATLLKTNRIYKSGSEDTWTTDSEHYAVDLSIDSETVVKSMAYTDSEKKLCLHGELENAGLDNTREESKVNLVRFINDLKEGGKVYLASGIYRSKMPSANTERDDNLPNNMACQRLMLPGFPQQSLQEFWDSLTDEEKKYCNPTGKEHKFSTDIYRPYIDSLNVDTLGIRQGSVFFDEDDKKNGIIDIYPSIEEMEINGQRVDEIYEGTSVTDDGVYKDGETIAKISIKLRPEIDFDINDLKDTGFTLNMKDGPCGGRSFSISGSVKENGLWKLTFARVKDDALDLWFPYKDCQIEAGNHFVLTGIELPDSYVRWNALKLLKYAIAYLDANDYTRFVYQPKVDEIFMARQHDEAMADKTGTKKSLHDTLKAGDVMSFRDTDFGIDAMVTIDQLTINEQEGKIPTYDITLREDKEVGTIQKMQNQISSLVASNGASGGGLTATQVASVVASRGAELFLSKTDPDTAQGTIAFTSGLTLGSKAKYSLDKDGNATLNVAELAGAVLKELVSQGFSQADKTGFWMTDADESGHSYLEIDKLYVRMKAIFDELEIRKRSYVGGNVIYSCAASKFTDVVWWTAETNAGGTETSDITGIAAFKCYIKTDDGTTETENWWKVNDLAICQTFNVNENSTVRNAQNKFYWRKVTDVGSETVTYEDGSQEVRGYIMLSNTTKGVGYADSGVDHTNDAALYGSAKVVTTGTETVVTDGDILTTGTSSMGVPSDFPEAEDSVTQLGNTDSTQGRGNALEIMVYTPSQGGTSILEGATCEAPALIQYHGITGFSLANKAKVVISPSGNTFKAKSFVIETGETSVRVPLDLGEWTKGTFYAYYSRVSHNGQLWLLDKIAENATTAEEPKDGCTYWTLQVAKGEDGDGLSVKGTVKGHWANYTAWMADGSKPTLTEGDKVALDSSSDIPTSACPGGVAKPTIVEYVNAPDYTYTATAANEGDGYMDGDGILWVAGATAWTNAGKIKGDKGDKGDDAEWYEIVARSATSGQQVQSIALDADGNPKTSVRLVLTQHIGSASTAITPSEVEMAASEGSLSEDSLSWVLQLSTTTSDSVTVTAKYLGKTYAVTLPCVRDGKQGDPGEATDGISALALSFTPSSLVFDTDDDGTLTGSQSGSLAVARGGVDYNYGKEYTCAVSAVENLVLSDMQSILSVSGSKPVVTVNSGDIKTYDTGLTDANGNKLVFPYTEGFVDIIVTTLKTPIETQHIRLSWHVNYAKYVGRQTVTQKEFKSEYEEYTASNDQKLKRVESSISQTAREISLSVSEQAIGRRNMLFGTALLSEEDLRVIHQPESSSIMTVLGGYGGTNALKGKVSYGGGFRWYGGSVGNIKIEKGKTYTFSCWVKTDHACTLDFELAYESSPSDTSRPAGGVFSVIGETITTLNEWQLVKGTYTMGQDYEYVEVFVFFTNHSGSGSGTHCICRPMMEEGDTYNGWTLSEDDADYIGGNMLDGTRSLTLGGNLTVLTGDVTDNGFGDSAVITADASGEVKDMLQWTVADSVAKGADYIFSFWAKGTGNVTAYLYPTTGDYTYTEACDGSSAWYSDGRASLALTSEWRRYWVHWSMKSDSLAQYCLLRASGGSVSISQPKLERGGKATDYTERSTDLVSKTQLKKNTGIDIESGIVTVTADNFVVQNNEGTRTALISADGTLNASLVQASKLETLGSTGSARVSIENGLISVFGAAGLCNIKFGVNDDGMAVLSYYNDDGVHLYDLGPNGFDDSMTTKAKVTEAMLGDILGTLGASQISDIASTGVLSLDGLWEVRKAYRQGLFGAGIDSDYSTPAGYAPTVSSSIKGKQYSCGYTEKTPTPDKERGLTTSALAKAADGLWFTGTPFAKDGALCNLLSGTYLKGTEKVRLSPKSDTLTDDIYCITLSVFTDGKETTATIYARYGKKV